MTIRLAGLAGAAFIFSACGGSKPAPEAESKAAPAPAPAVSTKTDSTNPAAPDTLKPMKGVPDTAKPAAKTTTAKKDGPLRDSAFGPIATVDSNGKVTPIKKRP